MLLVVGACKSQKWALCEEPPNCKFINLKECSRSPEGRLDSVSPCISYDPFIFQVPFVILKRQKQNSQINTVWCTDPTKTCMPQCRTVTKEIGPQVAGLFSNMKSTYVVTDLQRGSFNRKEHPPVEVEQIGVPM